MLKKRNHSPGRQLSEVLTKNGDIDRPVDATSWGVPKRIELREDRIYWDIYPGKQIGPSAGMFEAFYKLGDAPPQSILGFARKYGVLQICEHGLPCSHNHQTSEQCYPLGWHDRQPRQQIHCWEPLEAWRSLSRQALGVVKVADRLLQSETGRPEDWRAVYARSGREAPWWQQEVSAERVLIAECVNEWLKLGDVHPHVRWNGHEKKPTVKLGGSGLFGALAVQLALAVGQSAGFAVCTHCRREYPPRERRPKAGQRHFCPECREAGIPSRYSLADHRERLRRSRNAQRKTR
jgi:hypothetical protein